MLDKKNTCLSALYASDGIFYYYFFNMLCFLLTDLILLSTDYASLAQIHSSQIIPFNSSQLQGFCFFASL